MAAKMAWSTFAVVPEKIADSQFSSHYRGYSQSYGYKGLEDAAGAALKQLREYSGPTFAHVHIPNLDAAFQCARTERKQILLGASAGE